MNSPRQEYVANFVTISAWFIYLTRGNTAARPMSCLGIRTLKSLYEERASSSHSSPPTSPRAAEDVRVERALFVAIDLGGHPELRPDWQGGQQSREGDRNALSRARQRDLERRARSCKGSGGWRLKHDVNPNPNLC